LDSLLKVAAFEQLTSSRAGTETRRRAKKEEAGGVDRDRNASFGIYNLASGDV
jgi:hypothetical protein